MTDKELAEHWKREYKIERKKNKELEEQNTNLQEMLKAERSVTCKEEYLKRVTELEAHIEKMKCCENCKHHYIALDDTTSCKLLDRFASSKPCDKWEIKEK